MPKTRKGIIVRLRCTSGHEPGFWIEENMGTADPPRGEYGEFTAEPSGNCGIGRSAHRGVFRVPMDSYAYSHGGCCYRAAVETLHGLHSFHRS